MRQPGRGFTLVEVLLWLAALGIVVVASASYSIGDGAANEAQRLADALNIAARHARAYCAYAGTGDSPCQLPASACRANSALDARRRDVVQEDLAPVPGLLALEDRPQYRRALEGPRARNQTGQEEVDRTASFYADRSLPKGWCRVAPSALSLSPADGLPDLLTPLERTVWESSLGGLRAQSSGYCRDDGVCVCAQVSNESLRGMVAARVAGRQPNPNKVRKNKFASNERLLQRAIEVVDDDASATWPSDLVCAELPPSVDREFNGGGSPRTDTSAFPVVDPADPFTMTSPGSLELAWETIKYCHPCADPVTHKYGYRILSPLGTTPPYACTSPDEKIEVDLPIPDSDYSVLDAKAIDDHFDLSGVITSGQQLERRFVTLCFSFP